jgi:hypothetical protein
MLSALKLSHILVSGGGALPEISDDDLVLDILCFLPRKEEWMAGGCLKYVLPLGKAKDKIEELLEKVAKGEVESFSVSLSEFDLPKSLKEQREKQQR